MDRPQVNSIEAYTNSIVAVEFVLRDKNGYDTYLSSFMLPETLPEQGSDINMVVAGTMSQKDTRVVGKVLSVSKLDRDSEWYIGPKSISFTNRGPIAFPVFLHAVVHNVAVLTTKSGETQNAMPMQEV